ncbi:MAG: thiamine ABC transporter substrate-binding protein [Sediminispirochaetaceae bacterium]
MKRIVAVIIAAVLVVTALVVLLVPGESEKLSSHIVVYVYDSFTAEWGPGPQIKEAFEEKTGIEVRYESLGDAGQVLQRAAIEKEDPKADILLGIDNNMLAQAKTEGILETYTPEGAQSLPDHLVMDDEFYITPFDYGYFSIIYDSEQIEDPPSSLEDLTDPKYEESLILMDPRTSSPGLGFFLWTVRRYGDEFPEYWRRLSSSILTVTEGWDAGYGLFTNGEAPLVLSYTTSPSYHVEFEESDRYRAAIFDDGHYMQIEGLGLVKDAPHPEAAKLFIDFALSEEFQSIIPLTNWMYPVIQDIELPGSFDYAPKPEKSLSFSSERIEENREEWLDTWRRTITE